MQGYLSISDFAKLRNVHPQIAAVLRADRRADSRLYRPGDGLSLLCFGTAGGDGHDPHVSGAEHPPARCGTIPTAEPDIGHPASASGWTTKGPGKACPPPQYHAADGGGTPQDRRKSTLSGTGGCLSTASAPAAYFAGALHPLRRRVGFQAELHKKSSFGDNLWACCPPLPFPLD